MECPDSFSYFDSLPTEVIEAIFSHLSVSDRLVACLVCKRWLSVISNRRVLMDDICLVFRGTKLTFGAPLADNDEMDSSTFGLFESANRPFNHLRFDEFLIGNRCLTFLKNIGHGLLSLEFENCEIIKPECLLTDSCTRLQTLKVNNCDALSLFGINPCHSMSNLIRLCICSKSMMTDHILLSQLDLTMPNLEVLSVANSSMTSHSRIFRRFYPGNSDIEMALSQNPSDLIFSFQAVLYFIGKRRRTIKALDFSHTSISSANLIALSQTEGLRLEEISLAGCTECVHGLTDLCANQSTLKSLDLSDVSGLTDEIVVSICDLLPALESLRLKNQTRLGRGIQRVFRLLQLRQLDLSNCRINGDLNSPEPMRAVNNLVGLNLSCFRLPRGMLTALIQNSRNLTVLDLYHCDCVTDDNMHDMAEYLISLRTLIVDSCMYISNNAITGKGTRTNRTTFPLSNIKGLKELSIKCCPLIDDTGVKGIAFRELQNLNLSYCGYITDEGVEFLVKFNPSLEAVNLNGCTLLTDAGVRYIAEHCRRIKCLYLRNCCALTAASVTTLCEYCPQLTCLDVSQCPEITSTLDVGKKSPRLHLNV